MVYQSFEDYGKSLISVGPWGGRDGICWDDGVYSTVRQLVICHGAGIDSFQAEYDKKGSSVWSEKHGGIGGNTTDKVKLDYPDEFLTSIHGHYGSLHERGPVFIRSLTLESNKKTYGPFGIEQGTCFSFPMAGGKIVGFYGKCGWYLDAIGVYLRPISKTNPSKSLVHCQSYVTNGPEKIGYSVVQGSVGQNYDIVLAIRQKELYNSAPPGAPKILSRETSSSEDFSDTEAGKKILSSPASFERVPSKVEGPVTYGPWGGNGGIMFDDGIYNGVRQIILSRHIGIVSIKVLYDRNGEAVWGSKNGGSGGFKSYKIVFDYPNEILTHITGFYGSTTMLMGPTIIKSLTFHTTKGKHGPFGEEQGTPFSTNLKEGKIVGFHGRKGLLLDALGVHVIEGKVRPAPGPSDALKPRIDHKTVGELDNPQCSTKFPPAKQGQNEEVVYGVVKEPAPCGPGPWGGDGGRPWDDGVFSGIKQIFVTRSEAICSLQIEYDRNGQSVWSIKHGGNSGATTNRIKLEYPHEVLVCTSGYYGPINRDERLNVIKSLTFYTSRGKHGPFGEEIGTFFTSTTTEGKVVGFHGRSSLYLDAIGVHMQHWLGNHRPLKSSLLKYFS
ncbi:Jacalin-like lectin domain [Dillenia turbinata]|uniref:Jacalin-like lectin domain n=1 Tax=Dillenia turbinata TaxID=194707 RepID=A0AAN8ZIE6_9MAGN